MDRVDQQPLVHRGRGEYPGSAVQSPGAECCLPAGAGPQVPGEEDVTLDVGDGEVVRARPVGTRLAHEQQQRHLERV